MLVQWNSNSQKKSKWFFQADVSSAKQIEQKEFYFTTMKPQVDLFSFIFWKKLKAPEKQFEIIWPLASLEYNVRLFEAIFKCFEA